MYLVAFNNRILTLFKCQIRYHLMLMTGCEDEDEPHPPPPSRQSVEMFEAKEPGSGPSLENFVIDVAAPVSSDWNKRIINIFVKHFILDESNDSTNEDKQTIKKKVTAHIKYLIKLFRAEMKAAAGSTDWERRLVLAACRRRRLQVRIILYITMRILTVFLAILQTTSHYENCA
jgi:hypothetical protein